MAFAMVPICARWLYVPDKGPIVYVPESRHFPPIWRRGETALYCDVQYASLVCFSFAFGQITGPPARVRRSAPRPKNAGGRYSHIRHQMATTSVGFLRTPGELTIPPEVRLLDGTGRHSGLTGGSPADCPLTTPQNEGRFPGIGAAK